MCPGTEEHHTDSGVILTRPDVELEDDVLDKPLDVVVEVHGVDGGGCVQHEDDVRWLAAMLRQRLGLGALTKRQKEIFIDHRFTWLMCLTFEDLRWSRGSAPATGFEVYVRIVFDSIPQQ